MSAPALQLTNEVRELVRVAYECRAELQDQYVVSREKMRRESGYTPGAAAGSQDVDSPARGGRMAEAELARMKHGGDGAPPHASNDPITQTKPSEQPLPGPSSRAGATTASSTDNVPASAGPGTTKD